MKLWEWIKSKVRLHRTFTEVTCACGAVTTFDSQHKNASHCVEVLKYERDDLARSVRSLRNLNEMLNRMYETQKLVLETCRKVGKVRHVCEGRAAIVWWVYWAANEIAKEETL